MAHVLDQLAEMGSDLLANHYSITLPTNITELSDITNALTFRITNVSIPERTVSVYDITKRGRTFSRPSGNNEQSREVSFTFRPDKRLLTYNALSAWMGRIQSNVDMFMASDSGPNGDGGPSTFRADLTVQTIETLDGDITGKVVPQTTWILQGAFPTSLGGLEFDDTNGEPLTVDVTLNCFNIIYPGA